MNELENTISKKILSTIKDSEDKAIQSKWAEITNVYVLEVANGTFSHLCRQLYSLLEPNKWLKEIDHYMTEDCAFISQRIWHLSVSIALLDWRIERGQLG